MTDTAVIDQPAIDAQLVLDDAGIERAAVALCWAERPALSVGPISDMTPDTYWRTRSETARRLYLYRARCAVDAWERHMEANGG